MKQQPLSKRGAGAIQNTVLIAFFALGPTVLAQSNADALKQRVLAQAQSLRADDYAFTRTVRTEGTTGGKTEKKVLIEKFDPTKSGNARWTLVSVNGAAPSAEESKRHQKESAKRRVVPGYHRVAAYFGAPATASTDSRGKTIFRFPTLPKGAVSVLDTDVSHNASAEAVVGDANGGPFVEQVRFTVKPMRLKLVMKLEKFETNARYRIGPGGKPFLMESRSEMVGAGLGREGTFHTASTYSDYRTVR